ncbi:hypothetical protein D3C85_1427150 [compost metagenome]
MSTPQQTAEQMQARIDELEAQYQALQDDYDDEVSLCAGLLRTLVRDDYGYCEAVVKRVDCSPERKADTMQFIADVRDGFS